MIGETDVTPVVLIGLAARSVTFVAILLAVGAVTFRLAVLGRAVIGGTTLARGSRRAATVGAIAAAMVVPPAIARLAIQTAEMRFPDDPWISVGWRLVTQTAWGTTWTIQILAAVLLVPAFVFARRGGATRWVVPAVLAFLLATTPTMSSHARAPYQLAAISPTADALHVIAAGAWLGSLGILFTSVARGDGGDQSDGSYLIKLLAAFSPLALMSAAVVVLSGVVSSFAHIDRIEALLQTPYGRVLTAKLAGVLTVFFLGWRNWRHFTPQAASRPSLMRRAIAVELILAVIVLLVTAVLVVTPPPTDGMVTP